MAKWNVGEKNGNWKGGRTICSNGYVGIRMPNHPRVMRNGYVYEHILVAEKMLGRPLQPGEMPHHKNEIPTDNRPENLEVVVSHAEHRLRHRKVGLNRRLPGEQNPEIGCVCGCGSQFSKYDQSGRPRRFVSGHNRPTPKSGGRLLDERTWDELPN